MAEKNPSQNIAKLRSPVFESDAGVIYSGLGDPDGLDIVEYSRNTDYGAFPTIYGSRTYRFYFHPDIFTGDDVNKMLTVGFQNRAGAPHTFSNIYIGIPKALPTNHYPTGTQVDYQNFSTDYPITSVPDVFVADNYGVGYTDPIDFPYDITTTGLLVSATTTNTQSYYSYADTGSLRTAWVSGITGSADTDVYEGGTDRIYFVQGIKRTPAPFGKDADFFMSTDTSVLWKKEDNSWVVGWDLAPKSIDNSTDVDTTTTTPVTGDILRFDGTNWVNYSGFSGTFTNGDAATVTVDNGIITGVV